MKKRLKTSPFSLYSKGSLAEKCPKKRLKTFKNALKRLKQALFVFLVKGYVLENSLFRRMCTWNNVYNRFFGQLTVSGVLNYLLLLPLVVRYTCGLLTQIPIYLCGQLLTATGFFYYFHRNKSSQALSDKYWAD